MTGGFNQRDIKQSKMKYGQYLLPVIKLVWSAVSKGLGKTLMAFIVK